MELNKPIFVVGQEGGGTALLAAVINWHPDVGPKSWVLLKRQNINDFILGLAEKQWHSTYNNCIEQKDLWYEWSPATHLERELWYNINHPGQHPNFGETKRLNRETGQRFISSLTTDFHEKRFLNKNPRNTFRLNLIRNLFPNRIIIGIVRKGEEVVAARGFQYGQWKLAMMKWYNGLAYLNYYKHKVNKIIVYDELCRDPQKILRPIFEECELSWEPYLDTIKTSDRSQVWKERIPEMIQEDVVEKTRKGNEIINQWRML
jgi:hypothetical protein